MSLPVFIPPAEVAATLPPGKRLTLRTLCELAGIDCRVTGVAADRPVRVGESPTLRAVRKPGSLSEVWLGIPRGNLRARARIALGLLAYGAFDYGARETLRGLAIAKPSPGPGRPASGSALSSAERQRRYRERLAASRVGTRRALLDGAHRGRAWEPFEGSHLSSGSVRNQRR